jgi:Flp pilus assembly protein TadD
MSCMLRKPLLIFALLLCASSLVYAQPGATTGGIRGKIVVPAVGWGERIELLIERIGEEGQVFAVTYTDSLGNYFINGLPLGSYVLVVKLDGFKTVRERVDMGSPQYNANIPTINIILSREEPERALGAAPDTDVVDVKELTRKYSKKAVDEYQKGQEENRKGNSSKAAERLQNAVKIAPDFYYAHNYLGLVYEKVKRPDDAEREYKLARELNPKYPGPLLNLGRMYVEQIENRSSQGPAAISPILSQARDVLEEAIKLQPNSATGNYLLGVVYYKSSLDDLAEPVLKRALETGDKGPARLVLANLYIRQRKYTAAIEHLDAYLKSNPKSPDRPQIEQIRARIQQNPRTSP